MNFLARLALAIAVAAHLSACCFPSSEKGAERARNLSQSELKGLYTLMEGFADQHIEWGNGGEPLPEEFARVGALYGDVGHLDRLVFGGCVDDKAALSFEGLRGRGTRLIRLIPGEWKEPEILWRENQNESYEGGGNGWNLQQRRLWALRAEA